MSPAAPVAARPSPVYAVYVEGPRDRDILCAWARRVSPRLVRALDPRLVILGGRQPARAVEHFRRLRAGSDEAAGLCVLDRDGGEPHPPKGVREPGLEFFTWTRRHIESYLLVPSAIARGLRLSPHDGRVQRFFQEHFPADGDEIAWQEVEAKPIFGAHGPLARLLGREIPPGKVARAMRPEELHPDVVAVLGRIHDALGFRRLETTHRHR